MFPRYVGAQLHCHSSIEGPASIGAHCYEAKRAGVDVVWLTDHDTRISLCIGGPFIDRFDFDAPDVATVVERAASGGRTVQRAVGWSVLRRDDGLAQAALSISREHAYTGDQSMCLEATASAAADRDADGDEWQYFVVDFKADAKLHSRPLFAGAAVGLAVRLDGARGSDAEAWIDLVLSEQPPDLRQARLRYLLTAAPEAAGRQGHLPRHEPEDEARYRTRVLPVESPAGRWARYELRPGEDASADGLGGVDNALNGLRMGVRVRRGARLRLFVDNLTITHECAGNTLHARQRALARELAGRYGVVCHVAQEISQAGQHKNAWGARLPLLDYAGNPGGFTHAHGVAWAKQHEAVFSLNHPFSQYNRVELDEAARDRALAEAIERYAGARAWGADTLEVGFPAGRHGFDLDGYLRLWDGLAARGVYVLGNGSSDAHSARVGWQNGNNFATYIRADTTDEAALLDGLRSGDVYMADPVRFRSRLAFGDRAGHRMGQIVRLDDGAGGGQERSPGREDGQEQEAEQEVVLALDRAQPHWRLHWVVRGVRRPAVMVGEGEVRHFLLVDARQSTFVRAEIWDPSVSPDGTESPIEPEVGEPRGRCIALTNPLYYHRGPAPDDVPAERFRSSGGHPSSPSSGG